MDYAKKKNDELANLCKERGLAHTGKKADLVKRLEEHDAGNTSATVKPAVEDEIDWDEEPATEVAKAATTEPASDALRAGGIGEIPNPQNVPNQVVAEDPAQTDDLSAAAPVPTTTAEPIVEQKPEKDFSSGLADRTIDEEIEKRKARARKFGMPEDSDEIKALERAKRFGTGDVPGLLNKPLTNERKRGADADGAGGVRKRSRGPQRGRPGIGGRKESGRRERTPRAETGGGGGSSSSWMSKEDREAAERRKAKYAQVSS